MLMGFALTAICVLLYVKLYTKSGVPSPLSRDFGLFIPAIIVSGLLGVWGGSEHWAGLTDALPIWFLTFILPTFSIIESIRIRRVLVTGLFSAAVGLMFIIASLPFYYERFRLTMFLMVLSTLEGFLFGSIGSVIAKKKLSG